MAVIELDLDRDWTPPEVAPSPETRRRWWLLLAALAVLVAGGSAILPRAPEPALAVADSGNSTFQLFDGVLYQMGATPDGHGRIVARRLPSGRPLWTSVLPVQLDALAGTAVDGVLLGMVYRGPSDQMEMAALDAATGRLLWRADGLPQSVPDNEGRVLVGLGSSPTVLRDIDLRSGRVIWSLPLASGSLQTVVPGSGRIVIQTDDGRLQMLDQNTGRPLRANREANPGRTLVVIGGQLYVTWRWQLTNVIDAYDLATLAPRWQAESPATEIYVQDCGRVLCVASNGALEALDPATGEHLWYGDAWPFAGPLHGYLLADGSSTAVVDPATGKVRLALDRWFAVSSTLEDGLVFATDNAAGTDTDPGRVVTLFARLVFTHAGPVLRPLLALPGVQANRCQVGSGYVACRVASQGIRVWPLPS